MAACDTPAAKQATLYSSGSLSCPVNVNQDVICTPGDRITQQGNSGASGHVHRLGKPAEPLSSSGSVEIQDNFIFLHPAL
jgi:hypothetical protein